MNKLIRVILSLDPSGFAAGIITANSAVELLQTAIEGLRKAFEFVKSAIEGAMELDRLTFSLTALTGSAKVSADIIAKLGDEALKYGFQVDNVLPAVNQLALALKTVDGVVDPDKLSRYTDVVLGLSKVTGQSVDTIGDAVRRAVESGDFQALIRGVGINVKDMAGLSKEAQDIIARMQQGGEQQLGAVTKVGGGAKVTSEEVLKVLEEVTNKLGGGKMALEDYGNSFEGQVEKLKELWDNFGDTFGQEFEQAILPKLKEFVEYLIAHKDEIFQFAKTLADFTARGLIEMVDALQKIDWKQVGETAQLLGQFLGGTPDQQVAASNALTGGRASQVNSAVSGGMVGGSFDPGAGAAIALKKALGLSADWTIGDLFGGGKGMVTPTTPQEVKVTVSVDDNGKIQAIASQAATKAVGEVVDKATQKAGGNKGTSQPHGAN